MARAQNPQTDFALQLSPAKLAAPPCAECKTGCFMCGIPSAANAAWRNIPHCLNVHKEAAHSQCGKRGGWFGRGEKKKPEFSPPSKNKIREPLKTQAYRLVL